MRLKIHKLGIMGLVLILGIGLLLAYETSNYIKGKFIEVIGVTASEFIQGTMLSPLESELLTDRDPQNPQIKSFLAKVKQIPEVELVKIWNREGTIIHSTVTPLVGKQFPVEDDLKEAFEGKITYELSSLTKQENLYERDKYQRLYEIYMPLRGAKGNQVIGVLEIYWNADQLYQTILRVFYSIFAVLSLGFILVYASMYSILKRLTVVIDKKNNAISSFTQRLHLAHLDRQRAYTGTIQSLLTALDAKDRYTAGHSTRVADYSLKLGKRLNLPEINLELLEKAALFHDIGKIAVPEQILNKPGHLDEEEFNIIKKHPEIGEQIIQASGILDETAHIIRHHHERFDGQGYPDQIDGGEIPIESQILAVADTYDALTSNRPYRKELPMDQAINILKEASGTQLNPEFVALFIDILKE